MKRWALTLLVLSASVSQAVPTGKKWFLDTCTGSCIAGMVCTNGRCLPNWRSAATVENLGGTTINGAEHVPYATVVTRLQAAFIAWNGSHVTACATAWDVVYGGSFSTPSGTAAVKGNDGFNNIIFQSGGSWRYSSATLALTTGSFYTGTGQIFDSDMEFNNNSEWADTGAANTFDYESVAIHEAGHFLGLDHTPADTYAVMFPYVLSGVQKRALNSSDTGDVCTVYPGAAGGQGYPCTAVGICTDSRVCEGPPGGTQKICTQDCTAAGQTCPQGYTCQPSTAGFACLAMVGATDLCRFCSSGGSCSSGICLTDTTGFSWCSATCQNDLQCGSGYTCQATAAGSVCVPSPTLTCTNQCTGSTGCPLGYTCSSGACRPTGNPGDRCEISGYCTSCGLCVRDPADTTVAFCRTCCGGTSACNGCTSGGCDGGTSCVITGNNIDSICYPSTSAGICQACAIGAPCANGLACVLGKCHAGCNPASPGNCTACADQGGGVGICACPAEVSQPGESCATGTSFSACANGLVCVANPTPICRARCDILNPSSCPSGQSCQQVSTVSVCLPGSAGNVCAACTNAGTCNTSLSCFNSRCYVPCNVNASSACATCVQTDAAGNGVCACTDQMSGPYQPCGIPDVHACNTGLACVAGLCRGQCNPNDPYSAGCPNNMSCQAYNGGFSCLDYNLGGGPGGGGGGFNTGGGSSTGGSGGTGGGDINNSQGCGCNATGPVGLLLVTAMVLTRRRRR